MAVISLIFQSPLAWGTGRAAMRAVREYAGATFGDCRSEVVTFVERLASVARQRVPVAILCSAIHA
jgi:hypothetical protein